MSGKIPLLIHDGTGANIINACGVAGEVEGDLSVRRLMWCIKCTGSNDDLGQRTGGIWSIGNEAGLGAGKTGP